MDENFRDLKVKVCEIIFADFIFAVSNQLTFGFCWNKLITVFIFSDSVYSPRNHENKNPAKISRYTV